MRILLAVVFALLPLLHTSAQGQTGLQVDIAQCLQYERVKQLRGEGFAPFRRYGFHSMGTAGGNRLWGWHVLLDSTAIGGKPVYRIFKRHDIQSFGIIDQGSQGCLYVFWWKGYYRRFASDLRRMGFVMSNDPKRTNVLRFTRDDMDVMVDFIIWEDIYVMHIREK